jgi:hypothetical protein
MAELRKAPLIGWRIGGLEGRAVGDFDLPAMKAPRVVGALGGSFKRPVEQAARQALAGLTIRAVVLAGFGPAEKNQPGHDLANGLATGAARIEDLP